MREQVLPDLKDGIRIQEGFGNCLTPSREYMIIWMLLGNGYNSKSTLLNILNTMLGEQNVSNVSLGQFVYGRWFVEKLYRKLANIFGDIEVTELKRCMLVDS